MKEEKLSVPYQNEMKLFSGERLLVIVGLLGLLLAAGTGIYMLFNGSYVAPEGNLESVFSFNAAIGVFIISIAAFMPISGLSLRQKARIRWIFIVTTLFSYAIETIQHFRGINPRFSQVGSVVDMVAGGVFGLVSILIIVMTLLVTIPFFRKRKKSERPTLGLSIRYAFASTMLAYIAGIWMIVLQSRYTGAAGNILVLHGLGFHALQALPLVGWLLEKAKTNERHARQLIHTGCIAWLLSMILIGVQTALGQSVFEISLLSVLVAGILLIWVGTLLVSIYLFRMSLLEQTIVREITFHGK